MKKRGKQFKWSFEVYGEESGLFFNLQRKPLKGFEQRNAVI